jgi:hypothetical protein
MRFLAPAFANLLLLLAACGLGGFLRPLFPKTFSKIDRLSIIALGGLGFLGLLLFLIGVVRYTRASMLVLLVPAGALGINCLWQETKDLDIHSVFAGIPVIPAAVIALVLLITILGGFADPVGDIKLDTISYHYLGPHVWLHDHAIHPVLDSSLTAFPATVEAQYGALMAMGGPSGPELFAVISLIVFLLLAAATALSMGLDRSGAWWVAALLSAMPAVYRGAYGGMIDAIYAGFVLAAARIAFDDEGLTHSAFIGLFCGFAIGTKYTGLVSTVLLILAVALFASSSRGLFSWSFFRRVAAICLVAALVAAPWYVRNWVVLGCPMYPPPPLFYHFFLIKYLPLAALLRLHMLMSVAGRAMGRDPLSLLALPFNLTYHPANFESGAGGIGLVPLAFVPFSFWACQWNAFAKKSLFFALLQTIFWFFTMQESRYLIQVYVIAAILGVAGWRYVVRTAPRFGPLLSALSVATSIAYGLWMIAATRKDDIHAGLSPVYAEARKHTEIPYFDSFQYLNLDPSVNRVLILDESVPPYYLNKNYVKLLGKYGEQPWSAVNSPAEALSTLPQERLSHVLDVRSRDRDFQVGPTNLRNLLLVFESKNQRVYRVLSPGGNNLD